MTPQQARLRAREIYRDTDPSGADGARRATVLRQLVREGCDPVFAATAAGFDVAITPPPWLADLVAKSGEDDDCPMPDTI